MVDMASLLRAQLAHARLCPASEHPELPPATATALHTRPQSPRVTRRLQLRSTSTFPLSLSLLVLFFFVTFASICPVIHGARACVMSTLPARIPCVASAVAAGSARTACASSLGLPQLSSARVLSVALAFLESHTPHTETHKSCSFILHLTSPTIRIIHNICRDPRDPR